MESPFPGFDPYLEDQGYWRQFHATFLVEALYALTDRMPETYEVRIEERVSLVYEEDERPYRDIQPDALILRSYSPSRADQSRSATATAVLEPVVMTLPIHPAEEVVEKFLVVRAFPGRELVTVIELLSPSNKRSPGSKLYDEKRQELLHQEVHLVELDLLIDGDRLRMVERLPAGHFYAFISRAESRPLAATYAWTIRDPLPGLPIPLRTPDPDVILDLASVFAAIYDKSRVGRHLDYSAPLSLPLNPDDRAWAEATARASLHPQPHR